MRIFRGATPWAIFYSLIGLSFGLNGPLAPGQHGEAEGGYYPYCFNGDTFSGVLSSRDDDTNEIALKYTNPKTGVTENFVGIIGKDYKVSVHGGPPRPLKPSSLAPDHHLKVYYCTESKKADGKKTAINTIFNVKDLSTPGTRE